MIPSFDSSIFTNLTRKSHIDGKKAAESKIFLFQRKLISSQSTVKLANMLMELKSKLVNFHRWHKIFDMPKCSESEAYTVFGSG